MKSVAETRATGAAICGLKVGTLAPCRGNRDGICPANYIPLCESVIAQYRNV